MKVKDLTFRKNSKGQFVGSKKISDDLTIFYVLQDGSLCNSLYWNLSCSSNPKVNIENGVYYECEQLHDTIEGAKIELARFINVVMKTPQNYMPEVA